MTDVEKHNIIPQETIFTIGHNPPPPKTIQIDCDAIILNKKDLDISFKLDPMKIDKFDRLIINGINFEQKKLENQETAEWKIVVDDFDDGKGERELPHCSKCNRGVYRHDAGKYCPFCGATMVNPMN